MKHFYPFFFCLLLLLLPACSQREKESSHKDDSTTKSSVVVKYAKGFSVEDREGFRLLEVRDPLGESSLVYRYALVPRGTKPEGIPSDCEVLEVPVSRAICMTALQMSHFIALGETDKIIGINSIKYLFNEKIKDQIARGQTVRIGMEGNFDTELILSTKPDLIFVSPFKKGGYDVLRNLGIPLVTFLGYKEPLALGQAEWMKFIGLLLGTEERADEIFGEVEKRYLDLCDLADSAPTRPTVMSGEMHGGNWYVVGGKSFLANLFRDAGAEYFLKNDDRYGGFYVDFETVYSSGAETEFWRIANSYPGAFSYDALRDEDSRYADFRAFKEKKAIYCNLRKTPFYEDTPVEPDVVLADLIKIFHPDLLPDHTPVYYKILE